MKNITLEQIHKDVLELKDEIIEVKLFLKEDFELSDWSKSELKKARIENRFISHKDILKKYATQQ